MSAFFGTSNSTSPWGRPLGSTGAPAATAVRRKPAGAEVVGTAVPRDANLIGSTPEAPAAPNLPALTAAGDLAAAKQRKRVAKYAMLIEGQPTGQGSNPSAVLNRRTLLGY